MSHNNSKTTETKTTKNTETPTTGGADSGVTKSKAEIALSSSKFWLAVIIIGLYLFLVIFLFIKAGSTVENEILWSKYLYLFAGVEAIVFAAVGYVFATDVSRKTVELAKQTAENEKEEKNELKKEKNELEEKAKREKENLREDLELTKLAAEDKIKVVKKIADEATENLQKLRDAVLEEAEPSSVYTALREMAETSKDVKNSLDFKNSTQQSRALQIAKNLLSYEERNNKYEMDYEIKGEGIKRIEINGEVAHGNKGYVNNILSSDKRFCVEVYPHKGTEWEFSATNISDGNKLYKMIPTKVTSSSNRACFKIK